MSRCRKCSSRRLPREPTATPGHHGRGNGRVSPSSAATWASPAPSQQPGGRSVILTPITPPPPRPPPGSCPGQILDPASASSPQHQDEASDTRERVAGRTSFRVDVEAATRDLRLSFGVGLSNLEKALLPTGTVRMLELYVRGSVAVRVDARRDFPFLGMVSED